MKKPEQTEAIMKAALTQPEPSDQITGATPHGYYAKLNRKPKGAHESTPWEIFQNINGAKEPNFCLRVRSRADAEAQMWKLDRAIAEHSESLPKRTPEETAEDGSKSSPCDLLEEMDAALTITKPRRKSARTLQGETRVALLKELKSEPPCDPTDLLDELQSALTSAKMSEVDDMDFPEGTVTPDAETQGLIVDVIAAADEFRPMHEKLKTVVEKHRTKIVLLKDKFGVRKGCAGHRVVVGDIAMMWEEFVTHYFGVTPHRLNQLLDVKDEKDGRGIVLPTPDEEKHLFKKGLAAGERKNELAILSLEEKLAVLQATPDAHKLAERLVVLEALLEEREIDAEKRIAQLENVNRQLLLNPEMSISEAIQMRNAEPQFPAQLPVVKPTVEGWRKHNPHPGGRFRLKYFDGAASVFWDRYRHSINGSLFEKVLEQVSNPKHANDLKAMAAVLRAASDDLRMLAEVVEP